MNEKTTSSDQQPSQWAAIIDYSKAILTLCTAVLAVTAALSSSILPAESSTTLKFVLFGSWFFLFAAIIAALLASAFCVNYLRNGKSDEQSVLLTNVSFFAVVLAASLFVAFGAIRLLGGNDRQRGDLLDALALTNAVIEEREGRGLKFTLESIAWNPANRIFIGHVAASANRTRYEVRIDAAAKRLLGIRRVTPGLSATPK